jgi:hypothetical protein
VEADVRNAWLVVIGAAALVRPAPAGEPAETVVAGPLSAAEGLTLAGRVDGGSGPVDVYVRRYEFEDTGRWGHRTDALTASVPPGGRFRFTGLAPGRYACEFADQQHWFAGPHPDVDLLRDVEDHVLVVPSNCRLRGRVRAAYPDRESSAVRVSLGYFSVTVGADGTYETPDVPPGEYRANFRESWLAEPGPDRFDEIERSIPIRLDGVTTLDMTMTPDVPVALTVRSSRAGETFEGRFGGESALVSWERGWFRALADASGPAGMQMTRPSFPHGAACWTPVQRVLHLDGFGPGRHRLRLTALGFEPWEQGVDVAPAARVDAVMTALPGQFVEVGGLPDVARVEVRTANGVWREITSRDRRMVSMGADYEPTIVEFLPPGRHEWRAESLDGAPTPPHTLEVRDDRAVVKLTPQFASGRTVRGHLRSTFGRALRGVRIRFAVREGDAWRLVPTKDTPTAETTGAFETRGLSPGRWRAQLDDAGAVLLGEFDVGDEDVARDFVFRRDR